MLPPMTSEIAHKYPAYDNSAERFNPHYAQRNSCSARYAQRSADEFHESRCEDSQPSLLRHLTNDAQLQRSHVAPDLAALTCPPYRGDTFHQLRLPCDL